jgi:hypothetical protein
MSRMMAKSYQASSVRKPSRTSTSAAGAVDPAVSALSITKRSAESSRRSFSNGKGPCGQLGLVLQTDDGMNELRSV